MAFVHGKNSTFSFNTQTLTAFTDSVEWSNNVEPGETTVFGLDAKTYIAGLSDATFTVTGKFDVAASPGPRAVAAAIGSNPAAFVVGDNTATITGTAMVSNYAESRPVGDVVGWSAEFQVSGTVTYGTPA
jgi:hypothetical protein